MEIQIRSVEDFLQHCFSNQTLKQKDPQVFYRGVHEIYPNTPHIPSIYYTQKLAEHEHLIFKEVLSFFPQEILALKSTVERLIFMQHYRFPTRIMDITRNPLSALFFACFPDIAQESLKKDGMVYLYRVPQEEIVYCDSDRVSLIANLCRLPYKFSIKNIYNLDEKSFNKTDEITSLVHEIGEEKPYFHLDVDKGDLNNQVLCLRPRWNNPRIVRQDGYFFLFGIEQEKKTCATINPQWIEGIQYRIPHHAKEGILEELDILNINEAFVYPDYEHISNTLRKRYGG